MIAIIGMGVVGSAIFSSIKPGLINGVTCYDADSKFLKQFASTQAQDLKHQDTDAVFIAVPTPTNDGQDLTILKDILSKLHSKNFEGIVIINSTVLTDISKEFPKLKIVISPEFLNANSAADDFHNSKYIVLGGESIHTVRAKSVYDRYFDFNSRVDYELCTSIEAINFKYLRNIKQAYNLMFWEFAQDLTKDSRKMAQMMTNIPVGENSISGLDGYRGYGQSSDKNEHDFSACLDKDIKALIHSTSNNHKLLEFLDEYNTEIN